MHTRERDTLSVYPTHSLPSVQAPVVTGFSAGLHTRNPTHSLRSVQTPVFAGFLHTRTLCPLTGDCLLRRSGRAGVPARSDPNQLRLPSEVRQ